MNSKRPIVGAKILTMLGFLALLSTTYILRGEALTLSRIGFSADKAKADLDEKRVMDTYPERVKRHEVELKNYELQLHHYQVMLELYGKDYKSYVAKIQDKYVPPQAPQRPEAPLPAELEQKMAEIKVEFRQQKFRYFWTTTTLNWVSWAAALALVGGLLYLLMFDVEGQRLYYVVVLVLSFVFMIGPALQMLLSGLVGILQPELFDGMR
jgi:hypothetical protein